MTVYTYDDQGRMASSRPEVEWDETEQAWMRALAEYRSEMICPSCGWPREVCQSPEAEAAVEALPPTRCHVTTAIARAQEAWRDGPNAGYPEALLWGARVKAEGDGTA